MSIKEQMEARKLNIKEQMEARKLSIKEQMEEATWTIEACSKARTVATNSGKTIAKHKKTTLHKLPKPHGPSGSSSDIELIMVRREGQQLPVLSASCREFLVGGTAVR